LSFQDGYEIHALNGVNVPAYIVMTQVKDLDPKKILSEENVEIRREGVKKIGAENMIKALGGQVIDSKEYDIGGKYELLKVNWTNSERIYLKMYNPSIDYVHIESVHPDCKTVDQALGFRNSDFYGNQWTNKEFKYETPKILT